MRNAFPLQNWMVDPRVGQGGTAVYTHLGATRKTDWARRRVLRGVSTCSWGAESLGGDSLGFAGRLEQSWGTAPTGPCDSSGRRSRRRDDRGLPRPATPDGRTTGRQEAPEGRDPPEASLLHRAGDRARTGDPQLGKLMLYQLSYSRVGRKCRRLSKKYNGPGGAPNRKRAARAEARTARSSCRGRPFSNQPVVSS